MKTLLKQPTKDLSVIVKITDLDKDSTYWASSPEDCRSKTDKSGFAEAIRLMDVITMGKTIFEPFVMPSISELYNCIQTLDAIVKDFLPNIGSSVLQDYGRLNRGLIMAEQILKLK